MIGYETAEYHTIFNVCSKEGLDTEYVLYKVNAEAKKKCWSLIQAILVLLR